MKIKEKEETRVPEQFMEALARNRGEMGLPDTEGAAGTLMDHVPIIGILRSLANRQDVKERLANPELLHNSAGKELGTNYMRGSESDTFAREADEERLAMGGVAGQDGMMSNPDPEPMMPTIGTAGMDDENDPSIIPEEIQDYVERAHKATRESRPDEGWRIKSMEKSGSVAPYKRDEEEEEEASDSDVLQFAEGGQVPDPNAILQEIAPPGTGMLTPSPSRGTPMAPQAVPPPVPQEVAAPAPMAPPKPSVPGLTDQDFMNKANKMLGLGPDQQAGFMKLLGGNAQKAQLGAGLAGIGDAIASGGTLGKVNPGALNKSEDLIQSRTNEGIQGMQTIRGNQEKAFEVADKLEARDPQSPLSKWAQKAYGSIGKKLGLDLNNASAALIGDVTGKGVEALNVEYQNQLKQMGLSLQQRQVEATIGNQKAERDIAREGHQAEAAKTLADRGIFKTLANAIPGTAGHKATQVLERQALGKEGAGPVAVNSKAEYLALPAGTHYVDSFGTEKVKK